MTKITWRIGGMMFLALTALMGLFLILQGQSPAAAGAPPPIEAAASGDPSSDLVLSAVHIGMNGWGGEDEAIRLTNSSSATLVLTEAWGLRDEGGHMVAFPATGVTLTPGAHIWCARNAISFTLAFGFSPDLEYGTNSTPDVPDMALDGSFALANDSGSVTLFRITLIDTANGNVDPWPAGTNGPDASMERIDPTDIDQPGNWATSISDTIGLDRNGNPITGTPGYTNSVLSSSGLVTAPIVVINEIAWSGSAASDWDEWIELYNNTDQPIDLEGWMLQAKDGDPSITLSGIISAHQHFLLERADIAVNNIAADLVYGGNRMANYSETLRLYQAHIVDLVVYGDADPDRLGWNGPAVQQYASSGVSGSDQVLWRKQDESTARLMPDTNTAADWANDTTAGAVLYGPVHEGDLWGKRAMYPGWEWDLYTDTFEITATARVTVGIAPDNAYTVVARLLQNARQTILIEGYTFDSVWLTGILTERIQAGVQVTMLLEGGPAGGISDQELWNCKQIIDAGGSVYFMHDRDSVHARYTNQHAKVIIVDGRYVAVSSENFGNHAMPVDPKANGTAGNRGVVLITDQAQVVAHAEQLFALDCDPAHHIDVVPYGEYDYSVPPTYTAVYSTGGGGYVYMAPFSPTAPAFTAAHIEVVQSPETSLRYSDGLLGLVLRAGPGDEIYVEQMYERLHWGPSASSTITDPNPRLEAYIEAARRGAQVRILLDKGFDEDRKNYETALYILTIAHAEGLDLDVRLGNPTQRGIHNKMVLVKLGGTMYAHVGSLNGSEASSKVNRELTLQVQSAGLYAYLATVFEYDWAHGSGPYENHLPIVFQNYVPEARHLLISEVMFNPPGTTDLGEWIELYNPTASAIDIGGWYLGDAVKTQDYERMYTFPAGTVIPAGGVLVIARRGAAYQALGYASKPTPDFEFENTGPIPNMIATNWGTGHFALGNSGDEVLLFDSGRHIVDAVVYGTGRYGSVTSFGDVSGVYSGDSLERRPANRDSDNCSRDFWVQYEPAPGEVTSW